MWRQEHAITQHRLINIGNPPIFGAPPLTRPEVADLVPQRDALEHLGNHLIVDFVTGYFPIHGSIDDVPEKLRTDRDTVERWEGARDSYDWRTSREVLETPEGIEYGLAVFTKPESNTTMGWMRMNPAAHLRRLGEPTEGVHRAPALIAKVFHDLHKHLSARGHGILPIGGHQTSPLVDTRPPR